MYNNQPPQGYYGPPQPQGYYGPPMQQQQQPGYYNPYPNYVPQQQQRAQQQPASSGIPNNLAVAIKNDQLLPDSAKGALVQNLQLYAQKAKDEVQQLYRASICNATNGPVPASSQYSKTFVVILVLLAVAGTAILAYVLFNLWNRRSAVTPPTPAPAPAKPAVPIATASTPSSTPPKENQ